jgi:hypothetical protein
VTLLQSGTSETDTNHFGAFYPLPGGTLLELEPATYPLANQSVAANAVIFEPLTLSMMMLCPATNTTTWTEKQQIMGSLQQSLQRHAAKGGTYNVLTPALLYQNGILISLRDVSDGSTNQKQMKWQWDFFFPLLTLSDATAAQNNLMSQIGSGQQVNGDPPAQGGGGAPGGNGNSMFGAPH